MPAFCYTCTNNINNRCELKKIKKNSLLPLSPLFLSFLFSHPSLAMKYQDAAKNVTALHNKSSSPLAHSLFFSSSSCSCGFLFKEGSQPHGRSKGHCGDFTDGSNYLHIDAFLKLLRALISQRHPRPSAPAPVCVFTTLRENLQSGWDCLWLSVWAGVFLIT